MSNLEAGQKLWWVPSVRHAMKEQYVTIEKVGRKWATLAEGCGYRIDIKNLIADSGDYMSPGRCYLDRDAYELSRKTSALWSSLKGRMPNHPPEGVTYADIEQAAKLLKVAAQVAPF